MRFARDGESLDAFAAWPSDAPGSPVVIVMHGNAGLPIDIRDTVRRLAALNFVAIAANPTSREPDPSAIPRALLRGRGFGDRYIEDTRAALRELRTSGIGREAGVAAGLVGYCGGGYCGLLWKDTPHRAEIGPIVGLHVALRNYQADGTVSTERPQGLDLYGRAPSPIQLHYGTADALTPEADVRALERVAAAAGVTGESYAYQGANHGFALSTDVNFRRDHAELAFERASLFLRHHLK